MIAGLLGLFAATVGEDEINGVARFTFGFDDFKQGFDAKNKMWGMEDVQMYDIIKKQGIFAYRVHDTSIKHIWHEKHCGHLKSIDKTMKTL